MIQQKYSIKQLNAANMATLGICLCHAHPSNWGEHSSNADYLSLTLVVSCFDFIPKDGLQIHTWTEKYSHHMNFSIYGGTYGRSCQCEEAELIVLDNIHI